MKPREREKESVRLNHRKRELCNQPEILATIQVKSKRQVDYKLDFTESLMIELHWKGPATASTRMKVTEFRLSSGTLFSFSSGGRWV